MKFDPWPDVAEGLFYYPDCMRHIRILIVDDLSEVRDGLRTLLTLAAEKTAAVIEVVGDGRNGEEALLQAKELHPDVILMDLEMPILDGFAATCQIKKQWPAVRVVILSVHSSAEIRQRAKAAGADSFVEKGAPLEDLITAILSSDKLWHSFESRQGERS